MLLTSWNPMPSSLANRSTEANLGSSQATWLASMCRRTLAYAEAHDYAGYSKFDALNSPILNDIAASNKCLRLIFTQAVMRSPVNLRPLFSVPKEKNPKGLGLFAHAYCNLYALWRDPTDRERARYCLNWLMDHPSPGDYAGACWGYNFAWQTPGFYVPRHAPNMVVSTVVGQAFVRAFEVFGEQYYIEIARDIISFIRHDLHLLSDGKGLRYYSYTPFDKACVINVTALAAGLMARVYQHSREPEVIEEACELIRFVVDKQTVYGAWYYTDPPQDSPLTHDNYHTGFILDAILQYIRASGDDQWLQNYQRGLEFYARHLFLDDGAPKFLYNRVFPHDVHGAAQGILSFSRAAWFDPRYQLKAFQIAQWAERNLQAEDGHFYYQRLRFFTKRFCLMRWAQGWMSLALSALLASLEGATVW